MPPIRRAGFASLVPALALAWGQPARAEEPAPTAKSPAEGEGKTDRYTFQARSETYLQLFRRALLPGANGTIVESETALPIDEYVFADARNLDSPWHEDSVDLEVAAWGRLWPTSSNFEPAFDGDIQTANLRYHAGPAWVRLGRQQVAGGAARFARFDGAMVGASHRLGFFAEGYGGFTVLPRWNARPGYHHLGTLEGELTVPGEETLDRSRHWLAGGRVGYSAPKIHGSVSFHGQHEQGGLDQENLGLDVGARPLDELSLGASALLEVDSKRFAEARVFVDATPLPLLDLGAEFLRAEPALLLSRQSVLSVFTTDGYEELGGTLALRALSFLRFEANGYLQLYDGTGPGARGEIAARLAAGRRYPTLARLAYARVIAPDNGYQSVRASLSRKLSDRLGSTLEAYGYFYDERVLGYATSSVYAATLSYRLSDPCELLWGGSLAHSPYAALDAQTMVRASFDFDGSSRGGKR